MTGIDDLREKFRAPVKDKPKKPKPKVADGEAWIRPTFLLPDREATEMCVHDQEQVNAINWTADNQPNFRKFRFHVFRGTDHVSRHRMIDRALCAYAVAYHARKGQEDRLVIFDRQSTCRWKPAIVVTSSPRHGDWRYVVILNASKAGKGGHWADAISKRVVCGKDGKLYHWDTP